MKLARTVLCSAFRNVYGRDLKKKKKKKKNAEKILGSGEKAEIRGNAENFHVWILQLISIRSFLELKKFHSNFTLTYPVQSIFYALFENVIQCVFYHGILGDSKFHDTLIINPFQILLHYSIKYLFAQCVFPTYLEFY